VKKREFEEYSTVKDIYKALFTYEAGLTMTLEDLGKKLHEMYFESDEGESVAMIHLFGVKYAKEIANLGVSKIDIAKAAGINESYGTEISKGVKLARYVRVK
jgi:5-methylcytosine-specific restriction protein B